MNGNNKIKASLRVKLYLNYYILLSLFLIFLFIILNFLVSFYLSKSFSYQTDRLTEFLITLIEPYLNYYKYNELDSLLSRFIREENINYLIIYDSNDIILFYKYKDITQQKNYLIQKNYIYEVNKTFIVNDKFQYKLTVGFSKELLNKNNFIVRLIFIISYIILISGFFYIIKFTNDRVFINNIRRLVDIFERFSKGDYSIKLNFETNDEISIIANNLNILKNELIEKLEILEYIFENNPSLFILISREGIIKKINKNYKLLFEEKLSYNDLIDTNIFEYFEDFKYIIDKSIEIKDILKIHNYIFNNNRLKNNYFNIVAIPIIMDGEIVKFFIKIDDVTEDVKRNNNLLIIEKMESLNTLGAGIAHDFNNVLGSVNGIISLMQLESEFDEFIPKNKINEYVDLLKIAIDKGKNVSNRLLSFSKNLSSKRGLFDLNATLKSILDILNVTIDKSVIIEVEYYPDKAIFYGNENEIEQVFMNLLINSYHALTIMKKSDEKWGGTIKISIRKVFYQKQYVMYSTKNIDDVKDKEYWKITVEDNGVGIKKEHLNKIFDPFFTTKRDQKGTGLGLSFVFNVVESHEGFITVYSEEGYGTTFNVYLPVISIKDEIKKEMEKQNYNKGLIKLNKKCVIIEDDKFILETLSIILKKFGINILFQTSKPSEGLKYLKENINNVELIVLDYIMPEMNGIELLNELFKNKNIDSFDIKVILITGLLETERYSDYLEFKDKFFILNKPFGLYELSNLLKDIYKKD
ncbi:MAG: ATP-binding protein [Spirochaetes bacterium]|nr:ATP-binding protein [Spirochaetota bacterium]